MNDKIYLDPRLKIIPTKQNYVVFIKDEAYLD
jgi:hypothetical protein